MPKTQTKNPHPIVKILSDLNLTPKVGEEVDEKTYLRALMSAINIIESSSKDKLGDTRSKMLRVELKRVRELHRSKDTGKEYRDHMGLKDGEKHKKGEYRERRTTISGDKLMGREPKKDAPPTSDKPKLLTGVGNFKSDDVKPADIDPESKQDESSELIPKRLDGIANSVESIALLLRRQLGLQTKQQRDSRVQQDKDNKEAREDKLEDKPDKKTGGLPKAIAKPALSFFEKIKKFFLNIVIGSVVLKLFDWLKDPANAEKVTKFKDFLVNNAGWILGGLAAIALLPIAVSLVLTVKAVLAGLSLLGPLLPALPWILGGILLGAVAWWIGKKISRAITGGKVIGKERHKNLEQLRSDGILTLRKNNFNVAGEDGKVLKAPTYGENSLTGVEWNAYTHGKHGIKKDHEQKVNLRWEKHREWYARNYGQDALDQKLAAAERFETTRSSLIDTKKDMQAELKAKREEFLTQAKIEAEEQNIPKGMLRKRRMEFDKKKKEEWYVIDAEIRKKYGDKAIEIGDKAVIDKESAVIDKESAVIDKESAVIDKNKAESINISNLKPNKKNQNVVVVGGGSDNGGGVLSDGGEDDSDSGPSGDATDHSNSEGDVNRIRVGVVN